MIPWGFSLPPPEAFFRYYTDSVHVLHKGFSDYSHYHPDSWLWTFGDGQMSTLAEPMHTYAAAGVYEVCLTVSNSSGSDTYCEEVEIILNDTAEPDSGMAWSVYPNPADDVLHLAFTEAVSGRLRLLNSQGRVVRDLLLAAGSQIVTIPIADLPAGMYALRFPGGAEATDEAGDYSVV